MFFTKWCQLFIYFFWKTGTLNFDKSLRFFFLFSDILLPVSPNLTFLLFLLPALKDLKKKKKTDLQASLLLVLFST